MRHLNTDRLDSYLLHGPYSYPGLGEEDSEVWAAIEEIHKSGKTGMIGISNVNAMQLATLLKNARIAPMVVQNRCYAVRGWDREVREICRMKGISYQGFSLLTANPDVVHHASVAKIAAAPWGGSRTGDLSIRDAGRDGASYRHHQREAHERRPAGKLDRTYPR